MAYTHTFEIQVGDVSIEGEITFNGEGKPMFKTVAGEEMLLSEHKEISQLMEMVYHISKQYGEIIKIEFVKKPTE